MKRNQIKVYASIIVCSLFALFSVQKAQAIDYTKPAVSITKGEYYKSGRMLYDRMTIYGNATLPFSGQTIVGIPKSGTVSVKMDVTVDYGSGLLGQTNRRTKAFRFSGNVNYSLGVTSNFVASQIVLPSEMSTIIQKYYVHGVTAKLVPNTTYVAGTNKVTLTRRSSSSSPSASPSGWKDELR